MIANKKSSAVNHFILAGYGKYFQLNINQRINARQNRNKLNINGLFRTVLMQSSYTGFDCENPTINNGMYHHYGKTHSKYPLKNK